MSSLSSSSGRAPAHYLEHTSWRLLVRARQGDSAALNQLVHRYLPWLRRWARGRLPRWARSSADTSDLVQDIVARTIPRIGTLELRGQRALGAYLQRAVQNRIRDEHRRIARRPAPEALDPAIADSAPSALDNLLAREVEERYRIALGSLAPGDRELIVGHVELEYTHEQLGCMTHRSPNAARMALQRAIGRLAERMRDE
jgi:RNA polymerase sigma factor (sigma-70 family)